MQKCSICGADLPEDSRFCGKCGSMQNVLAANSPTTLSNTPHPPSQAPAGDDTLLAAWHPASDNPMQGNTPPWTPYGQGPVTPSPQPVENEDERRGGISPWPLYGAALGAETLLGGGQASTPGAPAVAGTPQLGSVPSVSGTPASPTNAPFAHPIHGPGNSAPASHPIQGLGNAAPVNHPIQQPVNTPATHPAPVSHPTPISHPIEGQPPAHEPPGEPGTHEHHPHEPHHHPHAHHVGRQTLKVTSKVARTSPIKTIAIVVTTVVVVAAGGIAAASHFLFPPPPPALSASSAYHAGNALAGAAGTSLHVSGQHFAGTSPITFLLDGHAAPGNPGTRSDANGNFSTNVPITDGWSTGTHTLSARDASNHSPKNGISVTVVSPGQANTPGPNGAPPDDASFKLNITVKAAFSDIADPFASNTVLVITGHPDPAGGTVCSPDDNGQSITANHTAINGPTPYTEVTTASCSGTYKAGQISYIETDTSVNLTWHYNSGVNVNCVQGSPAVDLQMTGSYAGNNTFSGTFNAPHVTYTCDQGYGNSGQTAIQGTWTGTIVKQ